MPNKKLISIYLMLILIFLHQRLLLIIFVDEDDDEYYYLKTVLTIMSCIDRNEPIRIKDYVEKVVPGLTNAQFQAHFRMSIESFELLFTRIGPKLQSTNKFRPYTKLMDPRKQLLAILWLLATPDSYRYPSIVFYSSYLVSYF